jgi:hypothetical protein
MPINLRNSGPLEPGLQVLYVQDDHAERATLPRCCGMLCSALARSLVSGSRCCSCESDYHSGSATWSSVPCDSLCGRQTSAGPSGVSRARNCLLDHTTVVAGFDRPHHARPKCQRV